MDWEFIKINSQNALSDTSIKKNNDETDWFDSHRWLRWLRWWWWFFSFIHSSLIEWIIEFNISQRIFRSVTPNVLSQEFREQKAGNNEESIRRAKATTLSTMTIPVTIARRHWWWPSTHRTHPRVNPKRSRGESRASYVPSIGTRRQRLSHSIGSTFRRRKRANIAATTTHTPQQSDNFSKCRFHLLVFPPTSWWAAHRSKEQGCLPVGRRTTFVPPEWSNQR